MDYFIFNGVKSMDKISVKRYPLFPHGIGLMNLIR